jgi:hypothetical protein
MQNAGIPIRTGAANWRGRQLEHARARALPSRGFSRLLSAIIGYYRLARKKIIPGRAGNNLYEASQWAPSRNREADPLSLKRFFAKRTQFWQMACATTICRDFSAIQKDEIPHLTPTQWLPKPATNQ